MALADTIMIPNYFKNIIDNLKQTHKEVLFVIESLRPERELEKAQANLVDMCRKIISENWYQNACDERAYHNHRGIILRYKNLDVAAELIGTIAYISIIKDGMVVGAYSFADKIDKMPAHVMDNKFSSAFSTDDLNEFIHHDEPRDLVIFGNSSDHYRNVFNSFDNIGKIIYQDRFDQADPTTSAVYAAYPKLKKKRLSQDLGM